MLFFKKKQKVRLSEFCQDFYDNNFLHPEIDTTYCELLKEKVVEADINFVSMDIQPFCEEMNILRFETFALAWYHHFGDKYSISNGVFTKKYLEDLGLNKIWENSESYNQAIANTATHGCDSKTGFGRARITFVNSMRIQLFKKYVDEGHDSKCVARTINRFGTNANWKSMRLTLQYLTLNLLNRLNCSLNDEAKLTLAAAIKGLYDGSKQNFDNLKIEL